MRGTFLLPPDDLAGMVRFLHTQADADARPLGPAIPFPRIGLFARGECRYRVGGCGPWRKVPRLFVMGATTRWIEVLPDPQCHLIVAVLQPGALRSFFDRDASRCTDRIVSVRDCWPASIVESLMAEIEACVDLHAAAARFAKWLAVRALHRGVPLAIPESMWEWPSDALAELFGYSRRHFFRLVGAHHGVRLAHLREYSRFMKALRVTMKDGGSIANLASLAARGGYLDQVQMMQDFHLLVGLAPGQAERQVYDPGPIGELRRPGAWKLSGQPGVAP